MGITYMTPFEDEGCTCQGCGAKFRVDVRVPDTLWARIKPEGKPEGAGLLCSVCIFARIEGLGEFGALCLFEVS